MTIVRFAVLPSHRIVNLASPRYLPEITRGWKGKRPFHDPRYDPVRDLMEQVYVDGFNRASRHYERLEESVRRDGFRNPVMVSAGGLDRRSELEIPPDKRSPDAVVCEYLGGSRLWVAQRLGLDVPCIVNDRANVFPDAKVLKGIPDVLERFLDTPRTVRMNGDGVYLNDLPYMHLPEAERYTVAEQSKIRRRILEDVQRAVTKWLETNDG